MSALDDIRSILLDEDEATSYENTWDELRKRITVLSDRAWESRVNWPRVEKWLQNFDGDSGHNVEVERLHALYLLSQFLYFGSAEIRVLLRALFRDLFLVPLIQEVRLAHGGTRDAKELRRAVNEAMERTRFLGVGNPSESGVHLLYFFRQENGLSKHNFLDSAQIMEKVTQADGTSSRVLRHPEIDRYVFLDDVCGSGETAIRYSKDFLEDVRAQNQRVQLRYHSIFSTADGMKNVREKSIFGSNSSAVYELDLSYRCISTESRYLKVMPPLIVPEICKEVALHYGEKLLPGHGGGYEDSQMLIGFHHNTPDNTLPIVWREISNGSPIPWTAIFRRYPKI